MMAILRINWHKNNYRRMFTLISSEGEWEYVFMNECNKLGIYFRESSVCLNRIKHYQFIKLSLHRKIPFKLSWLRCHYMLIANIIWKHDDFPMIFRKYTFLMICLPQKALSYISEYPKAFISTWNSNGIKVELDENLLIGWMKNIWH